MRRRELEANKVVIAFLLSMFLLTVLPVAVCGAVNAANVEKPTQAELLINRPKFIYSSLGKRDPFMSLVSGEFHGEGIPGLVSVGDMELVGVLHGGNVVLAMVEDSRGRGYVLRVGDPVMNGMVKAIRKDSIEVEQTFYGDTQTVVISMRSKEGEEHEK
ncbi:MAG: hypothetical protein AMJ46_04725 [Latescibacteria bacterium DG_63]|nr:MAG: hypothetical protein AMJ46_04725 [Latescibacteria bacterium DG_63]